MEIFFESTSSASGSSTNYEYTLADVDQTNGYFYTLQMHLYHYPQEDVNYVTVLKRDLKGNILKKAFFGVQNAINGQSFDYTYLLSYTINQARFACDQQGNFLVIFDKGVQITGTTPATTPMLKSATNFLLKSDFNFNFTEYSDTFGSPLYSLKFSPSTNNYFLTTKNYTSQSLSVSQLKTDISLNTASSFLFSSTYSSDLEPILVENAGQILFVKDQFIQNSVKMNLLLSLNPKPASLSTSNNLLNTPDLFSVINEVLVYNGQPLICGQYFNNNDLLYYPLIGDQNTNQFAPLLFPSGISGECSAIKQMSSGIFFFITITSSPKASYLGWASFDFSQFDRTFIQLNAQFTPLVDSPTTVNKRLPKFSLAIHEVSGMVLVQRGINNTFITEIINATNIIKSYYSSTMPLPASSSSASGAASVPAQGSAPPSSSNSISASQQTSTPLSKNTLKTTTSSSATKTTLNVKANTQTQNLPTDSGNSNSAFTVSLQQNELLTFNSQSQSPTQAAHIQNRSSIIDSTQSNMIYLITLFGSILLILLVIAVTIFIICRERKRKREKDLLKSNSTQQTMTFTSTSQLTTQMTQGSQQTTDRTIQMTSYGLAIPLFLKLESQADIEVEGLLAQGGMGSIYFCKPKSEQLKQHAQNHKLVVKRIDDRNDLGMRESFFQELAILYRLSSKKNSVQLYGYFDDPFLMVMKFYPLGDLNRWIRGKLPATFKYSKWSIIHCLKDLCSILSYMHQNGLVHHDLKPQNVLLEEDPQKRLNAVLSDFGLTHIIDHKKIKVSAFRVKNLHGFSIYYAAPEILQKVPEEVTDHQVIKSRDIYALGIMICDLLKRTNAWLENTQRHSKKN